MSPLTADGLTVPRLADLRATARAAIKASPVLGPEWQTGTGSELGQILDVLLTPIAECYELLTQVVDAFDPDAAEGVWQDRVAGIIGVVREPAAYCQGVCQCTGVALTVIPIGTQFRQTDGPIVATTEQITLTGGADDVACTAIDLDTLELPAGSVTDIVTPVVGLASVAQAADFTPGQAVESASAYRTRREENLVAPSASTDYGIGAALAALTSVTYARAVSDRAAHTVRCLVYPNTADTDDVAGVIWDTLPAGMRDIGAQSAIVTDEAGNSQTVYWDWVSEQTIVFIVNVTGIPNTPANVAAIKAVVTAELARGTVGTDVYAIQHVGAVVEAMGDSVTVCTVTVDGGASVAIDDDEIAVTSDPSITVNITP